MSHHDADAKSLLRELINSTRLYERTNNLEDLLKLLRRRGLYNKQELSALSVLKTVVDDENFTALLTKHQNLLSSFQQHESSNIYGEDEARKTSSFLYALTMFSPFFPSNNTLAEQRPTSNRNLSQQNPKRNEIYNEIANSLTQTEFLSFARCLKLAESEIKEIELQNNTQRTRTLVLLDIFEQKNVPMKILPNILALVGRDDLVSRLSQQYAAELEMNAVVALRWWESELSHIVTV